MTSAPRVVGGGLLEREAELRRVRVLFEASSRGTGGVAVVEGGEPPADRFAAIHGLYWLCANRAERGPLVVLVDDAQWVDDPSLAWLGYLARRTRDLPLLLVLGLRSGDPGAERSELERLLGDDEAQRIAPGPLSVDAVAAIVRAQLDPDADERFCMACGELTGGNPLFAHELLAAARAEGLPGQRPAPRNCRMPINKTDFDLMGARPNTNVMTTSGGNNGSQAWRHST